MKRLLFALSLSLLSGCASLSRPYYAGHLFEPPRLTEQYRSQLVRFVHSSLDRNLVQRIEIQTPEDHTVLRPHGMNTADIDWLPLPALIAIRHILAKEHRGVELDFLTRVENGAWVPVTARHELDQRVVIQIGPQRQTLMAQSIVLTPQQLTSLYRLKSIESGTAAWSAMDLAALQQALATLSAEELAQLADVRFVRSHHTSRPSSKSVAEKTWGQYVSNGTQRTIYLYDTNVRHDELVFVGTPEQPLLATAHCLLHEIGHALADVRQRPTGQGLGALPQWGGVEDAEDDENHVLTAYAEARGAMRGPTPYGATALKESFAESFALFRADPAALSRISPSVHEWFLRGGHLHPLQNLPAL
jgi:hypothetical protein